MRVRRTGVTIPNDVLERLDNLIQKLGLKSRSKVITEAVQSYIAEREALLYQDSPVIGIVAFTYLHTRGDTMKKLVHVQHHHLDSILFNTHVHLTEDRCLEVVMFKGKASELKDLVKEVENIPGVELVKFLCFKA